MVPQGSAPGPSKLDNPQKGPKSVRGMLAEALSTKLGMLSVPGRRGGDLGEECQSHRMKFHKAGSKVEPFRSNLENLSWKLIQGTGLGSHPAPLPFWWR